MKGGQTPATMRASGAAPIAHPFFTIGHSTRTIGEFVTLLGESSIQLVIDVRTIPRSRTNPQYNLDSLSGSLAELGICYEHIATLGGLRGRKRDAPEEVNGFWRHRSFHNYADYAMTSEDFQSGLGRLRKLGHDRRCAIMCAEAVWWRCHRRIVTDYLIAAGETVFHILGRNHVEAAQMTSAATPGPGRTLVYPPDVKIS